MASAAGDAPAANFAVEASYADMNIEGDAFGQDLDRSDPVFDEAEFRRQAMESLFKERTFLSRMPASAIDTRPCRKWVLGLSEQGFRTWSRADPKAKAHLSRPVTSRTSVTQGGLGHAWKLAGMSLTEVSKRIAADEVFEKDDEDLGFLACGGHRGRRRRRRTTRGGGLLAGSHSGSDGSSCTSASGSEDAWDAGADLQQPDEVGTAEAEAEVVSLGSEEEIAALDDNVVSESDDDVLAMDVMQNVAKAAGPVCLSDGSGSSDGQPLLKRRQTAGGSGQLCTPMRGSRAVLAGAAAAASAQKRPAPVPPRRVPPGAAAARKAGACAAGLGGEIPQVGVVDVDMVDLPDWPL